MRAGFNSTPLGIVGCIALLGLPAHAKADPIGDKIFGCFAFVGADCDADPQPFFGNLFDKDTARIKRGGPIEGAEGPSEFSGVFQLSGSEFNITADFSDMNAFGGDPFADAFVRIFVERTSLDVFLDPFFVLFDDLDFGRIVDIAVSASSEFRIDRLSFSNDGFLIQVSEPIGDEGTVVDVEIYVEPETRTDGADDEDQDD